MDLRDIKTKRLSDIEKKVFFLAWLNEKLKAAGSRALPVLVGGARPHHVEPLVDRPPVLLLDGDEVGRRALGAVESSCGRLVVGHACSPVRRRPRGLAR